MAFLHCFGSGSTTVIGAVGLHRLDCIMTRTVAVLFPKRRGRSTGCERTRGSELCSGSG